MLDAPSPLFCGTADACAAWLQRSNAAFCVYILTRPDGRPFYVGEGIPSRPFDHVREARLGHKGIEGNPHKCNVIRSILRAGHQVGYSIDSMHPDKPSARRREGALILALGRTHEGGPLTNLAGGHAHPDAVAPFSRERHTATLSGASQDPERAALNAFFASICPVGSTPIKPMSGYRSRIRHITGVTKPGKLTARSAGAIAASAACNGTPLTAGLVVPRRFAFGTIEAIVENGVAENIVGSGVVTLLPAANPADEAFCLSPTAVAQLAQLLDRQRLLELGLL